MHAAIVRAAGQAPVYGAFDAPIAASGERVIRVTAAALSHLARMRASGRHYSSGGQFPFIAGVDGVGQLEDGQRVYFLLPRAPFGAMAEQTLVPDGQWIAIPDALDDVTAAALANPGMSSWAALTQRAQLKRGECVLINGATGISGRLAVQIARHLGARKIVVTGRNADALRALGADTTISLAGDDAAQGAAFRDAFAQSVDVVIDYLWGPSALGLLTAAAQTGAAERPVRFVQVGAITGANIALPAALLRSSAIEIMGSGLGSVSLDALMQSIAGVMQAAVPAGLQIDTNPVPLAQLEAVWAQDDARTRTVFTMNG